MSEALTIRKQSAERGVWGAFQEYFLKWNLPETEMLSNIIPVRCEFDNSNHSKCHPHTQSYPRLYSLPWDAILSSSLHLPLFLHTPSHPPTGLSPCSIAPLYSNSTITSYVRGRTTEEKRRNPPVSRPLLYGLIGPYIHSCQLDRKYQQHFLIRFRQSPLCYIIIRSITLPSWFL